MSDVRIIVDLRPGWHQWMMEPLDSEPVKLRMRALADSALRQYRHAEEVHVIATCDGRERRIRLRRGGVDLDELEALRELVAQYQALYGGIPPAERSATA